MTQPKKDFVGENFERARNTHDLGALGDPERWGWSQTMVFLLPANATIDLTKTSRQLVRVQVPQLIARKWSMVCSWEFFSDDPAVTLHRIDVDAVMGVGQTSIGLPMQAFPVPNVQTPLTNAASGGGGATDLGEFIAATINARVIVTVHGALPANPVTARVLVGLAASPRSL